MLAFVRNKLLPNGGKLVGVQVRVGDKDDDHKYAGMYAPVSWNYYRNAMYELSAILRRDGAAGVAFIVTAGGSLGSNAADVAHARDSLSLASTHSNGLHFSTAQSPHVDLAVLRSCDALVIGPSTFGWWAAYLAELPAGHVVAPRAVYNRSHRLAGGFRSHEYYPASWRLLKNDGNITTSFYLSPPPPPPPRPLPMCPTGRRGSGAGRSSRCFLKVVGHTTCPLYARPQYHTWWPMLGGVPITTPQQCVQRAKLIQLQLKNCGGQIVTRFCHPESK